MCPLRVLSGLCAGVAMLFAVVLSVSAQDAGGMDLDIIKEVPSSNWSDPNADPNAQPKTETNPLDRDFESALDAYRERDYVTARDKWGDLTDAGHGLSMHNLAVLKWRGQGGARERSEALELFRDAGQNKVPQSLHALGVLSLRGAGVPPDAKEAVRYFNAASDLGHPPSMYNLALANLRGIGGAGDTARGMELMTAAAEAGLARAQYDLGTLLYNGTYTDIDKTAARMWFERAAENGDPFGYYNLAQMQFAGEGGGADPGLAAINLTEAAEMGAVPAQVRLAHLLAAGGPGVGKDPAGAYAWFRIAGALGAEGALENAKRLGRTLDERQRAEGKRRAAAFRPKRLPETVPDADVPPARNAETAPAAAPAPGIPAAPQPDNVSDKDAKEAEDLLKTLQQ